MKWKAWKKFGWMDNTVVIAATETIPAISPSPETQEPHWKTDESADGQVRDSNGAEVFTPKENLGHQRPA